MKPKVTYASILVALLVGCGQNQMGGEERVSQDDDLRANVSNDPNLPLATPRFEDQDWILSMFQLDAETRMSLDTSSERTISVRFKSESGRVDGSVFCNTLGGVYVYSHGYLAVSDLGLTDDDCNESASEASSRLAFGEILSDTQLSVTSGECSLILQSGSRTATFTARRADCGG